MGSLHHTDLSLLPRGFFSFSEHREEGRAVFRHYPLVSLSHCSICTQDPPGAGKAPSTASLLQPNPLPSPASQTSHHIPLGSRFGYQTQRAMSVLLFWGLGGCCRWSLLQPWPGLALDTLTQPMPAKSWASSQERTAPNGNSALAKPGSTSDPAWPGRGAAPHFYLISSAQHDQEPLQASELKDKSR